MTSMLLEIREAARTCSDDTVRAALRSLADRLQVELFRLGKDGTEEHLRNINGMWARAQVLLKAAKPPPEPEPPQSEAEVEQELRLAA